METNLPKKIKVNFVLKYNQAKIRMKSFHLKMNLKKQTRMSMQIEYF